MGYSGVDGQPGVFMVTSSRLFQTSGVSVPKAKVCIFFYAEHILMSHTDTSSRDLNVYD